MKELKSKIEAILFCMPEGVDTKRLAKLCGIGSAGHVKSVLQEMQKENDKKHKGVFLTNKAGLWFFRVKDEHTNLVKEVCI